MKKTSKKIKRLLVTIGIVVAVSIVTVWIGGARFNRILDNIMVPKESRKRISDHSKRIHSMNKQSSIPPAETKQLEGQSPSVPNTETPTRPAIPQKYEYKTHKEISDMMAASIREGFPELDLSESELIELGEIVMEIRESIRGLRQLDRNEGNLELFKEFEARRSQALLDFERITGMSILEFLRRTPSKGGITYDDNPEAPAKFKYLHDFKP